MPPRFGRCETPLRTMTTLSGGWRPSAITFTAKEFTRKMFRCFPNIYISVLPLQLFHPQYLKFPLTLQYCNIILTITDVLIFCEFIHLYPRILSHISFLHYDTMTLLSIKQTTDYHCHHLPIKQETTE